MMSELNYKELQEQGIFDVPYRAFEFMQEQQKEIDALKEKINNVVRVVYNETDDYYIDEKIQEILHDA